MSQTNYSLFEMQNSLASLGGSEAMDSTTDTPHSYYTMQSSFLSEPNASNSATIQYLPPDELSSGFQSASLSNFPSTLPSSSSTTINDHPPHHPPPPPPDAWYKISRNFVPSDVIDGTLEHFASDDKVILSNAVTFLFGLSIDIVHGSEVCRKVAASPVILNAHYNLLTSGECKSNENSIFYFATGNLTHISKYEPGREAILGFLNGRHPDDRPSRGVRSLINSLQSCDNNVVIVAITAVHNLLLDRRGEVQDIAKKQIKHADGIKYIVKQLANQDLMNNHEFKLIVLDCLQIIAYRNTENRLAILESDGPRLLLDIITPKKDFPSEELVESVSRVLKSLSVCPESKVNIIRNNGIEILTYCIELENQEILKTCLWTLRNLSDIINTTVDPDRGSCINQLVERLLKILDYYAEDPCIVTCALGVLANLTCNNEHVKRFICDCDGVKLLLNAIDVALRDCSDFRILNNEILEPAVCTLCHLMNQLSYPRLEQERQRVRELLPEFNSLTYRAPPNEDLAKAVGKLNSLLGPNSKTLYI